MNRTFKAEKEITCCEECPHLSFTMCHDPKRHNTARSAYTCGKHQADPDCLFVVDEPPNVIAYDCPLLKEQGFNWKEGP